VKLKVFWEGPMRVRGQIEAILQFQKKLKVKKPLIYTQETSIQFQKKIEGGFANISLYPPNEIIYQFQATNVCN
jgi:hypothetical protein